MKVLVIEDEEKTALYLRKGLSESGFIVDICGNGEEALYLARQQDYDLLIVDVLLLRRDGWSVLAELRKVGKQVPILLLSAFGAIADKERGLRLGANDYLVKPFDFSELLARIRSVQGRGPALRGEMVRIADLELDLAACTASRSGRLLDLTPKEFQFLALLGRHSGEVFSWTAIAEQVWDMKCENAANVVDVHVQRLRSKVDDPFEKKLIHTVRGLGYVLADG